MLILFCWKKKLLQINFWILSNIRLGHKMIFHVTNLFLGPFLNIFLILCLTFCYIYETFFSRPIKQVIVLGVGCFFRYAFERTFSVKIKKVDMFYFRKKYFFIWQQDNFLCLFYNFFAYFLFNSRLESK